MEISDDAALRGADLNRPLDAVFINAPLRDYFDFIEGFYNRRRRHSTNGYLSPHDRETRFQEYDKVA